MNLTQITQNFLNELKDASKGKHTSLPFIKHKIPEASLVKENEIFQVLVIGGSMGKSALVKKTNNNIVIVHQFEKPLPVFHTKEDFLNFIAELVDPKINVLAVNFAYPLQPIFERGRLDGIFSLGGGKEHSFEGLIGEKVGQNIEKFLKTTRNQDILVSVANDTICLLLSGLTKYKAMELGAGIVGTGLNFAFFLDAHTPVNLEAASFDKFLQTESGKMIDQSSNKPGSALFEKETSGAYLFTHFNLEAQKLNIGQRLNSTAELSELAKSQNEAGKLAMEIITRSAELISCQIAGISLFKKSNMTFVLEGSLFWKGYTYKTIVEKTVKQLAPQYNFNFIEMVDSGILGAAKLAA